MYIWKTYFKDSKMLVYLQKKDARIVRSCIISNNNTIKRIFFKFISLFSQISTEKIQIPLFEIIWLYRLYQIR